MNAVPADIVRILPSKTRLQLVRDAVVSQSIPQLMALEEGGAFDFTPPSHTAVCDGATFNAFEVPGILAVGELVANALRKGGSVPSPGHRAGMPYRQVHERGPKGDLSDWFGGFVERFVSRASEASTQAALFYGPASLEDNTMKVRVLSTTGALLATACAIGHAGATSDLCGIVERGDHHLSEQGLFSLMVSDRILDPRVTTVERMWHPARVAMDFCQPECLSILMAKGWDPERSPLACSSEGRGDPSHARPWFDTLNSVIVTQRFLPMMSGNDEGFFPVQPGIADLLLNRLVLPDAARYPTKDLHLRQWAERFFESEPRQSELMAVAGRHGLYAIEPHLTLLKAAKHGCAEVLPHLEKALDWAKLPDIRQPMASLFNAEQWHSNRPTGAMAMERFSVALMRLMVEGRQAHRILGEPAKGGIASSDSPIQNFAQHGAAEAVLACMEQGADPIEKCSLGVNALMCANAGNHENVVRVIHSFLARQAAEAALRDCSPTSGAIEP